VAQEIVRSELLEAWDIEAGQSQGRMMRAAQPSEAYVESRLMSTLFHHFVTCLWEARLWIVKVWCRILSGRSFN